MKRRLQDLAASAVLLGLCVTYGSVAAAVLLARVVHTGLGFRVERSARVGLGLDQ